MLPTPDTAECTECKGFVIPTAEALSILTAFAPHATAQNFLPTAVYIKTGPAFSPGGLHFLGQYTTHTEFWIQDCIVFRAV